MPKMATASTLTEDHLSCSICYRPFSVPKTLNCLHTFCQDCLQKYINVAGKVREFPCPVCRESVMVPDPMQPRIKWADQLKTDFKIVGILEAVHRAETESSTGLNINSHLSEIDVFDDRDVDSRGAQLKRLLSLLDVLRPAVNLLQVQIEEEKEKLEEMDTSRTMTEALIRETVQRLIESVFTQETILLEKLWTSYDEARLKIEEAIRKRQDLLESSQDSIGLIDRLLSPGSQYATVELLPSLLQQHEEVSTFLSHPNSDRNPWLQFSLLQDSKSVEDAPKHLNVGELQIKPIGESIRSPRFSDGANKTCGSSSLPAVMEDGVLEVFEDEVSDSSSLLPTPSVEMDPSVLNGPRLEKHFSIRVQEDTSLQLPCDSMILPGKGFYTVVVVDCDNGCVKTFYTKDGRDTYSRLSLDGSPHSLAKIDDDRIVVSVTPNKLCILGVTPELKLISTVKTQTWYPTLAAQMSRWKCFGIGKGMSASLVGGKGSEVHLLDLKGKFRTWANESEDSIADAFSEIASICTNPSRDIIVSDAQQSAVACITKSGHVRWRYQPQGEDSLNFPTGVMCDKTGKVYVAVQNQHRVIELTPEGKFSREVLTGMDGLEFPMSVSMDDANRFYVTQCNGEVKIYSQIQNK